VRKKGVGAAASRRFAKEGYHVLVAGRPAAKVETVADSIRAANGSQGGGRRYRRCADRCCRLQHGQQRRRRYPRDDGPARKEKAGADGLLNIEAIADSYWHLHTQHRSAWTHEIDLRPYKEPF
jgi:NAD(P)-dependent dehydrogenase (short-subunit alcohol dehydrogenase family)